MIDLEIKHVKEAPIKFVYANGKIIGCFYYGRYVERCNFTQPIREKMDAATDR